MGNQRDIWPGAFDLPGDAARPRSAERPPAARPIPRTSPPRPPAFTSGARRKWIAIAIGFASGLGLGLLVAMTVASIKDRALKNVAADRDRILSESDRLKQEVETDESKRKTWATSLDDVRQKLLDYKALTENVNEEHRQELARANGRIAELREELEKANASIRNTPASSNVDSQWIIMASWSINQPKTTENL